MPLELRFAQRSGPSSPWCSVSSSWAVVVTLALFRAALLKQRIEREEGHQLRTLAGNVGQVLADNLFDRSREIEVLAGAEDMWAQGLGSGPAGRLLERAKSIQPDNTWIGVTDTDGGHPVGHRRVDGRAQREGQAVVLAAASRGSSSATCTRPRCSRVCCHPPTTASRCASSTSPPRCASAGRRSACWSPTARGAGPMRSSRSSRRPTPPNASSNRSSSTARAR